MDKIEEKLVDYVSALTYEDLSAAAIHAVKRSMIDAIGCALAAFDAVPVKALRNLAARMSAVKPATLIGTQIRTSPDLAGFVNSGMIRYLDFGDDYFGDQGDSGPHPSDNIGGILAAAETADADGRTLVLGVALAYEICDRLVDQTSLRARGWDYPVLHATATALGTAKVLGLTREQMRNALALAVVPNIALSSTKYGELSNWKSFAGPNGSRNGFFATLLAREGLTGPSEPFEGKGGFMKQLDNPFELDAFGGKGRAFKIEDTFFKYLPVRYTIQLPVWAALELGTKVKAADIESICVYTVQRYAINRSDSPADWNPRTRETAGHSVPYLVAAALIDGEIGGKTLTPERYLDPAILATVQKVRLQEDEEYTAAFPKTFHCRIEAALKSGEKVCVHKINPKGHPANPMSDDEIAEKFLKQVDTVLPTRQGRSLLAQLWELEKIDDVKKLFPLMLAQSR